MYALTTLLGVSIKPSRFTSSPAHLMSVRTASSASFLDGFLAKFTAKEMKNFETLENNSLNFWSFLSRVDKKPQEVINLDLRPFFESLSSGVEMSWEEFMRDFIGEILRDFPYKLKYAFCTLHVSL